MSEIQFTLRETPVSGKEAEALIKYVTGGAPLQIEITKFVKIKKLDPKTLFMISVEENNPELASLAWRLSTNTDVATPVRKSSQKQIGPVIPAAERTMSSVVQAITSSKSKWAAGAAMIMWALYEPENIPFGKEHELSLREICTMVVNYMSLNGYGDKYASLFRGYTQKPNGQWEPVLGGVPKTERYHYSSLYICGRQGILWLKENGVVSTEKKVSYGGLRSDVSETAKYTQRKYYAITGSQFGEDCYDAGQNWINFAVNTAL